MNATDNLSKDEGTFIRWTGKTNVFEPPFPIVDRGTDIVILIGMSREDGKLSLVGLYETEEAAGLALAEGAIPDGYWISIMKPSINGYVERRISKPE